MGPVWSQQIQGLSHQRNMLDKPKSLLQGAKLMSDHARQWMGNRRLVISFNPKKRLLRPPSVFCNCLEPLPGLCNGFLTGLPAAVSLHCIFQTALREIFLKLIFDHVISLCKEFWWFLPAYRIRIHKDSPEDFLSAFLDSASLPTPYHLSPLCTTLHAETMHAMQRVWCWPSPANALSSTLSLFRILSSFRLGSNKPPPMKNVQFLPCLFHATEVCKNTLYQSWSSQRQKHFYSYFLGKKKAGLPTSNDS